MKMSAKDMEKVDLPTTSMSADHDTTHGPMVNEGEETTPEETKTRPERTATFQDYLVRLPRAPAPSFNADSCYRTACLQVCDEMGPGRIRGGCFRVYRCRHCKVLWSTTSLCNR